MPQTLGNASVTLTLALTLTLTPTLGNDGQAPNET